MNAKYLEVSGRTYYAFEEPEFIGPPSPKPMDEPVVPRTIDEYGGKVSDKPGFWRRQFSGTVTTGQKRFDWFFGVIMPTVCFFFDPIVFSSSFGPNDALLGGYKRFAFLLSFTAILATMALLLWGEKLKWANAFLSGLFAVSSLAALAIGIFLLPFSIFGLAFLIGALGFTPLFTSFVFWRNSVRSFRAAQPFLEKDTLANMFAVAAIASIVIPYLFNLR